MSATDILNRFPDAASSPLALLAYCAAVAAWTLVALKVRRNRNLLAQIEKVPESDRARLLQAEMDAPLPPELSPAEWLRARIHRYYLIAFIALLSVVVLLVVLTLYSERGSNQSSRVTYTQSSPNRLKQLRTKIGPLADAFVHAEVFLSARAPKRLRDAVEAFHKGEGLLLTGDIARAREAFEVALALEPTFQPAQIYLVHCLVGLQKLDEAVAEAKKAVVAQPASPQAQTALGIALSEKQEYQKALAAFERAKDLAPTDSSAFYNQGLVYWRLHTKTPAEQDFLNRAQKELEEATRLDNKHTYAWANLAFLHSHRGLPDKALRCASKAVETAPYLAEGYDERANAYGMLRQWASAKGDLLVALRLGGPSALRYARLGDCFTMLGRPKEALEAYDKALKLDPRMIDPLIGQASAYIETGQAYRAEVSMERLTTRLPHFGLAWLMLAKAQLTIGNRSAARESLKRLKGLDAKVFQQALDDPILKEVAARSA